MEIKKDSQKDFRKVDLKSIKSGEWTEDLIIYLINRSDLAVSRGMVAIYHNQDMDERDISATKHINGIGFSKFDAWFGTSIAKQILEGKRLSDSQIESSRKMLYRYRRQLCEIANQGDKGEVKNNGTERPERPETTRTTETNQPRIEPGNGIGDSNKDTPRCPRPSSFSKPERKLTVNEWIERDQKRVRGPIS